MIHYHLVPMCDAQATAMGWTECLIDNGEQELHISHAPDADLNGTFRAFCHDEQEMLSVSGWQISSYERLSA